MPVRPNSIVQFDWIYLAIIALGLVGVALTWDEVTASVQVQQTVARFGMGMIYVPIVIGVLIQLALWYFIARRGSVVAKWIFVILTGLGALWAVFGLATRGAPNPAAGVVDVASIVLQVIAIVLLFRPDTRPWFGEAVAAA